MDIALPGMIQSLCVWNGLYDPITITPRPQARPTIPPTSFRAKSISSKVAAPTYNCPRRHFRQPVGRHRRRKLVVRRRKPDLAEAPVIVGVKVGGGGCRRN